ncbi:hypothetical protein NKG94_33210 [Micromonospora sp. M12]
MPTVPPAPGTGRVLRRGAVGRPAGHVRPGRRQQRGRSRDRPGGVAEQVTGISELQERHHAGGVLQHGRRPTGQLRGADDGARGDQVEQVCRSGRPGQRPTTGEVPDGGAEPLEEPPAPDRNPGDRHQQHGHQYGHGDDRRRPVDDDQDERRRDPCGDQLAGAYSRARAPTHGEQVVRRRTAAGGRRSAEPRRRSADRPGSAGVPDPARAGRRWPRTRPGSWDAALRW